MSLALIQSHHFLIILVIPNNVIWINMYLKSQRNAITCVWLFLWFWRVFELFCTVAGVKKHPHLEVNGLFGLDFREVNPFYPVPLYIKKNTFLIHLKYKKPPWCIRFQENESWAKLNVWLLTHHFLMWSHLHSLCITWLFPFRLLLLLLTYNQNSLLVD